MTLTSSNPESRLTDHFKHYFATFYYIHRTSFLKMIHKEMLNYTSDTRFGEILLEMLTVIYGNIKTLNILYGARESILTSSASSYKKLDEFIKDGTFVKRYSKFRNCLVHHLIKNSDLDARKAKKIVNEGMNSYLTHIQFRDSFGLKQFISQVIRRFATIVQRPMINITQYKKLSLRNRFNLKHWNYNIPSSKYQEEFINIRRVVLKTLSVKE
ncbi:MAG: hypothetical protein ACFFD4_31905, partial [Candidatus Odinarchaeota archaeon]